jgi:acyl-CoA thioesterase-1
LAVDAFGPVAYWRLGETAGGTAADRAGNADGLYRGGAGLGATGLVPGDAAARFDGVDDHLEIAPAAGEVEPIRLAAFGDSFVAGFGLSPGDRLLDDLSEALEADGYAITPLEFGQNGRTTAEGLAEMPNVLAADPDLVVLVLGTNDALHGRDIAPGTTEANLRSMLTQFESQGVDVLLTGTFGLWPDEVYGAPGFELLPDPLALADQFEALFPQLAAEFDLPLLDPFLGGERVGSSIDGGVLGDPALNQGDGVHASAAGIDQIVARLLPQLELALGAPSPTLVADPLQLDQGTISLWVAADDTDGRQGLLSRDSDGLGDGHMSLYLDGSAVVLQLQDSATTYSLSSGPSGLQAGDPAHIAFSFGAGGARLYLDGQQVDSDPYAGGLAGNEQPLVIGALAWASSAGAADNLEAFFDGVIDEVAVFDQALSAQQVAALYDAGVASPALSLVDDGSAQAAATA